MKIIRFQFEDKSAEWRLEELRLNKLTLLVGASGVGKTQILRFFLSLREIAEGQSLIGRKWEIEFQTLNQDIYIWSGEFANTSRIVAMENFKHERTISKIITEKLYLNNNLIVNRNESGIFLNDIPTVKLSQSESILSLLSEEELIKPAYNEMLKIYHTDCDDIHDNNLTNFVERISTVGMYHGYDMQNLDKYKKIQDIQEANLDILQKFFLCSQTDRNIFSTIKNRFKSIFPSVEDVRFDINDSKFMRSVCLQIKEKNVSKWIHSGNFSQGMFRTLIQLSELYLCAKGTVFLIDEFENSLGINCINEIMNDILVSTRQLQFILTSHHPYIIDAIGYQNWKLVTRNGGVIKTHDLDKFHIGKSKHSAFMQLLQLEEYQTGQEQILSETN